MFKSRKAGLLAAICTAGIVSGLAAPAFAESLADAIALAYQTNPTLREQRANLRALDETVVQARSGYRPDVSASVNYGISYDRYGTPQGSIFTGFNDDSRGSSTSAAITLDQPLYTGGRVRSQISAAQADVETGRQNLRTVESNVLSQVIQFYVDVRRDIESQRIADENVAVLQRQLDEARARFEVGEITRTDVAQSEARLAQSEADLANTQAQLSVSRAAYAAVVGQAPGDLAPMPILPGVPADFDSALDVALEDNPGVRAAGWSLRAAEANVAAAKAEYLPSIRATASYGGSANDIDRFGDIADDTQLRAGATLSVPLFTGGLNGSRVAQALERANVAQINVEGERRNTLQAVSSAYAQSISARSTLEAGQEAVRAATVAAEGVRQEAQVGLRTTLDVLNQELELRNAEVTLASARRNEYVAQANLLAAMGRLEGPDLDPTLTRYDPAANYDRVRNRGALPWDGVIETIDRLAAPPVVPAQDAEDAPVDQQLKSEVVRTAPRD